MCRIGLLLSCVVLVSGLTGCGNRSRDAELARARAEAELAKAELERERAKQGTTNLPSQEYPKQSPSLTPAEREIYDLGIAWAKSQNYPIGGLTENQILAFGRQAKQEGFDPTKPTNKNTPATDPIAAKLIGTWTFGNRDYRFDADGRFSLITTGELLSQSGTWKIANGKLVFTYSVFINTSTKESEFTLVGDNLTFKVDPLYQSGTGPKENVTYKKK